MPSRSSNFFTHAILAFFLSTVGLTVCCSAQTEEQALDGLRQVVAGGIQPTDDYLANIERRFAGKRAGSLAKLLHAKIKFDNKDFAGAAALLNSEEFAQTKVADYALFLRGQALAAAGDHARAMPVFERLTKEYPDSINAAQAELLWADSAIAAGQAPLVPAVLDDLNNERNAGALLRTAKAFELQGDQPKSIQFYRRTYFFGAGTDDAKQAEAKLTSLAQPLTPANAEEAQARAEGLFAAKNFGEAEKAYTALVTSFRTSSPAVNLKRVIVYSNLRRGADAQAAFNLIPVSANEKEQAYYHLAQAYARSRMWPQTRQTVEEMRQKMPTARLTAKAWVDAGMTARDLKNKLEEQSLLRAAVTNFPNAVEVAGAQFELAWMEHDAKNFARSSQMLTEHLARYADKDTSNRGKAGYWAARDSERAGKTAEACALYDGVIYRYSANWYGYLAQQRVAALKQQDKCSAANFPAGSLVAQAVSSLSKVTVAPETAGERERIRIEKSRDLADVTLFDWASGELEAAQTTARNSPTINLALAQIYRRRGDNVGAFLALAKTYPDYSQMFPEEMGKEEWDIFYPLINWKDIKYWAAQRGLDAYQVAGLIRQESVFNPRARSGANAYGLMQLIIPTAQSTARKYGSSSAGSISVSTLYNPSVNIELGTAYLKDQLDKFGRIEYVAAAYNAGPGRIPGWRATLPYEMDEFVEAIPFRETKAYVQGVIRNSAQYRRLYDENGNFKSNVGSRALRSEIDGLPPEQFASTHPEIVVQELVGE